MTIKYLSTMLDQVVVDKQGKLERNLCEFLAFLSRLVNRGFTGTITTAKLTGGGTNGSITFQNGIVVAQVAAT